ncbi:hypothetical protein QF001_006520 [Paraburkholderia youngii]
MLWEKTSSKRALLLSYGLGGYNDAGDMQNREGRMDRCTSRLPRGDGAVQGAVEAWFKTVNNGQRRKRPKVVCRELSDPGDV